MQKVVEIAKQLPTEARTAFQALQRQAQLKADAAKTGRPDWLALAKVRRIMQDGSPWTGRIVREILRAGKLASDVDEQWLEQVFGAGRLDA